MSQRFRVSLVFWQVIAAAALFMGRLDLFCAVEPLKPASWSVFESNLVRAVPKVLPADKSLAEFCFETPAMRGIRDQGSMDMWMEMACQGEYPITSVGGFLCVKEKKPDQALAAALATITAMRTNASLLLYAPVIVFLTNAEPTTQNLAAFTRIAGIRPSGRNQRFLLTSLLSAEFILQWLETAPVKNASPDILCDVVDRVATFFEKAKQPFPPKLATLLDSFATEADGRLIVFVLHTNDDDPRLRSAMARLLRSSELSDNEITVPIYRKREYIEKNLKYRELDLEPGRVAIIDRVINRKVK